MRICVIFLAILIVTCNANKVVSFRECADEASSYCKINNVSLSPCSRSWTSDKCYLSKKRNNTITVDYTPYFQVTQLYMNTSFMVYNVELPLPLFDRADCFAGTWPVRSYDVNILEATLHVPKVMFNGMIKMVWRMWDENDDTKQCCFTAPVKITRTF